MSTDKDYQISPFPSASEMDMDLWRCGRLRAIGMHDARVIVTGGGDPIVAVPGNALIDANRDATARRIEMMGDVYEELRKLVEAIDRSGGTEPWNAEISTEQARAVLREFVAPKPFPDGE